MSLVVWFLVALIAASLGEPASAQSALTVDPRPMLEIRGSSPSGEVLIEHPIGATRLDDGTLVVGDDRASLVRFFDRSGRQLRTFGRPGAGPGEFRRIWWLGRCGSDSLYVWDLVLRRMTVVGTDGSLARQFPVPANTDDGAAAHLLTCSSSGILAYQPLQGPRLGTSSNVLRSRAPVMVANLEGRNVRIITEAATDELVIAGGGGGPRPLGKRTSLALHRDRLFIGTADSGYVEAFDTSGNRHAGVALGRLAARQASPEAFARAIEETVALVPGAQASSVRRMLTSAPVPDELPPYGRILTDPAGLLWVVLTIPGETTTAFRVFDSRGRQLATLEIPVALTVFEIGRDYLLGAYTVDQGDHQGESAVVLYRVRR